MATETPTVVNPEVRNDEEYEVIVPPVDNTAPVEGLEDVDEEQPLPRAVEVPPVPAAAPAAAPSAPVAATPAPQAPVPQAPLSPAAREERNKRKMLASKYAQVIAERDRALSKLDERTQQEQPAEAVLQLRAALTKRANEANDMGELLGIAIDEIDRVDRLRQAQIKTHEVTTHVRLSDLNARLRYPDYDQALKAAGITEALGHDNGKFRDPYLARQVYLAADPGEEAYQLAKGKLEHERMLQGGDEDSPVPSQPAEVAPAAAPAATVVADAERRGAQRVVEAVNQNAARPKGVRGLRPAGGGESIKYTKRQLDEMMEKNPSAYERLVETNVGLERWHLGG